MLVMMHLIAVMNCPVCQSRVLINNPKLMAKESEPKKLDNFLSGKSRHTKDLLKHFTVQFLKIGQVEILPAKTMIGIATSRKRVAYITHLGKDFIHVVFPLPKAYKTNLCFQKIAQVPGDVKQFNHHFRMYSKDDLTDEVIGFMRLAIATGI